MFFNFSCSRVDFQCCVSDRCTHTGFQRRYEEGDPKSLGDVSLSSRAYRLMFCNPVAPPVTFLRRCVSLSYSAREGPTGQEGAGDLPQGSSPQGWGRGLECGPPPLGLLTHLLAQIFLVPLTHVLVGPFLLPAQLGEDTGPDNTGIALSISTPRQRLTFPFLSCSHLPLRQVSRTLGLWGTPRTDPG